MPLSPYCNPVSVRYFDSLEVFPNSLLFCVSFFAEEVSRRDIRLDTYAVLPGLIAYPPNPLKAGYAAHSIRHHGKAVNLLTAIQVFPCAVNAYALRQRHSQSQASTEAGSEDPCRWKLPRSLNSQHPPQTGRSKLRHQKLHRCAILRIFRPAFRRTELTRILHRY